MKEVICVVCEMIFHTTNYETPEFSLCSDCERKERNAVVEQKFADGVLSAELLTGGDFPPILTIYERVGGESYSRSWTFGIAHSPSAPSLFDEGDGFQGSFNERWKLKRGNNDTLPCSPEVALRHAKRNFRDSR